MMDRTTGKTLSEAYIELGSEIDAAKALEKNQKPLKGRLLSVTKSSQEDLMKAIFPKWKGKFQSLNAVAPSATTRRNVTLTVSGGTNASPLVTREETNSILVVCRNFKLHFSRKCAERPFEQVISVLTKMPWHQPHMIATMQRDHLFEMLKIAIESLMVHLRKDYVNIDDTLLERLVRSGLMVPMFTDRQKNLLINISQTNCPEELSHYMLPPLCLLSSSSIASSENELITQQLKNLDLGDIPSNQLPAPFNNRTALGEVTNQAQVPEPSLSNALIKQVQEVARVGSKLSKVNPKASSVHKSGRSKENLLDSDKENQTSHSSAKEDFDPRVRDLETLLHDLKARRTHQLSGIW
jgi:hypothetical protein